MSGPFLSIVNGHQLRTERTAKSIVLAECVTDLATRTVRENRTAIPDAGDFRSAAVHTAEAGAGVGRFSHGPRDHVLFANAKEACIWAGPEMRCAAVYTIGLLTTALTDLTWAATDNVTSAATNFYTLGLRPGMRVSWAGTTDNNLTFTIKSITDSVATKNKLTFVETTVTNEGGGTGTGTVSADVGYGGYENPIEATDAANTRLETAGNILSLGGGNDAYTKLLLHCDGTEGSTTFTDSSASGHTVTANGNAQITTASKKFGTGSALLDGTGDYLSVPDHADWYMGTGLVTLEAWFKGNYPIDFDILNQYADAANYWYFHFEVFWGTAYLRLKIRSGASTLLDLVATVSITVSQLNHVAALRGWGGDPDVWAITLNGVAVATTTASITWPDLATQLNIGRNMDSATLCLNGNMDEIRVSKGIARWTSNFGVPGRQYQDPQLDLLLFSTRPLKGGRIWTAEGNSETTAELSGKTWTGAGMSDVDLEDYTQGLSITADDTSDVEDTDLVSNGGFASVTTGWTGIQGDETLSSETGGESGNCLKILEGGTADPGAYQDVAVTAGLTYFFECFVMAGDEATYQVDLYDTVNATTLFTESAEAAADWSVKVRHTFTAPSGCDTVRVKLIQVAAGAAGTYLFFDTASLTQVTPGTFAFPSTVGSAKPMHFEGLYLFCYQLTLSSGFADIAHITLDAPFQPVGDVWDGVYVQCIGFHLFDATIWKDYTLEVNEPSDSVTVIPAVLSNITSSCEVVMIFPQRIAGVLFSMIAGSVNTNAAMVGVEYNGASGWVAASGLVDGSISDDQTLWKSLSGSGIMSFDPPDASEEMSTTLFGTKGWAYRFKFDATLSSDVKVDTVYGIPAPGKVKPCRFPSRYKNMVLLCGDVQGREGNRVDFSAPNAPDVFNGDLSSKGGLQSLFFGSISQLMAGEEIFNRFGSNIYTFWLALGKTETAILHGEGPEDFQIFPLSRSIGSPMPLTLATAEVGWDIAEGVKRNVAMWCSFVGPIFFDGAVFAPIPGIENLFDPRESGCINYDAMDQNRGWFDAMNSDYHLLLCTGSSTVPDVWVAYSLTEKKWREIIPAEFPRSAWPVVDENGAQYVFAGFPDGYVRRMDNGNDWDGAEIVQVVETGDFWPGKNVWSQTRLKAIKVMARRQDNSGTAANLTVTHYGDTDTSGTALDTMNFEDSSDTRRLLRFTRKLATGFLGWAHRLRFSITRPLSTEKLKLFGWGVKFTDEKEDF